MKTHAHKHAFSLVESVLVLGIISLVIGGIWVVAQDVRNRQRYTAFVSDFAVMVDHVQTKLRKPASTYLGITEYLKTINIMPAYSTYGIDMTVVPCMATGSVDYCATIGDVTGGKMLSQSQCVYIGRALRTTIMANPTMLMEVTTVDEDGAIEIWWDRAGGFRTLTPNCGVNQLAFKAGPGYKDDYFEITF